MSKTATTWELKKSSWHVLIRDKALLLFPVISGVACILVLLTFIAPAIGLLPGGLRGILQGGANVLEYVLLFCYYLCNFFVIFYFNAALVAFVDVRLRGSFGMLAVAAVLYLIALGIVISALRAIFGTVLYLYAKNGTAPDGFARRICKTR